MHAEERVHAAIDRLEPVYRGFLQALVRVPSMTGQEGEAQALVAQRMTEVGLMVDVFDIDRAALGSLPGFNPSPRNYAGRPCAVGRAAGSGGGRSLILNAHIDTVPVDEPGAWTHDPFGGSIVDGRMYGRGAWDDKAGVVESLLVAHALREAGIVLAGDLIVQSVIEDESTGNGSLACVARGHTADAVIIVDGTWPERYIVSHMGHVTFQIHLDGAAGHATSGGPNPLDAIGLVVEGLRRFVAAKNASLSGRWGPHDRPAFLNLGRIHGGVWPGSVPASCVIEGQYGFPPPGTTVDARDELASALSTLAADPVWPLKHAPSIVFDGLETPPVTGDRSNAIARLLSSTIARLHGATIQESVIRGHCDLRHFTHASRRATPDAVLYGPGGGQAAHGPDEYFELAHLRLVAKNLASVALAWCGSPDDASRGDSSAG
jgi:acetylornithine deacetylase